MSANSASPLLREWNFLRKTKWFLLSPHCSFYGHIVSSIKDSSGWLQGSTGQEAWKRLFQEEKGNHKEYLGKLLSFYQTIKDFDGKICDVMSKEFKSLLDKKKASILSLINKNQKRNYLYKFRKLSSQTLTLIKDKNPNEDREFYKISLKKTPLLG